MANGIDSAENKRIPLEGFNFLLRVDAKYDLPCKSIKAFSKENEYEYIQEGGLNDFVHIRRKPVSKPFTFEVERYVTLEYIDPLPNGAELNLPVALIISHEGNNFVAAVSRTYTFTGCTVIGKQYGQLDAESSGLLLETTTIAYQELAVMDESPNQSAPSAFGKAKGKVDKAHVMVQTKSEVIKWNPRLKPPVERAVHLPNTYAKLRTWKPMETNKQNLK